MNKTENRRFFEGLRSAGWSEKKINRFLHYLKTGEDQYRPKPDQQAEKPEGISEDLEI